MLINPLREIRDEVTLITGITESMLRDKPLWSEVKEKVKDFIGDAIIV
jgi:DNA polymerase III epsilon subunit-like protein